MPATSRRLFTMLLAALAISSVPFAAAAQQQERGAIADKYKWDLAPLFPSDEAWQAAKEKIAGEIPKLAQYKGTLASSPKRLADALDAANALSKEFARAYIYANMKSDEDTRVSKYQAMVQEMQQLAAKFGAETAFMEPEILKIDRVTIDKYLASEPRLGVYAFYINDIQRRREHTLTDSEERLLASASVVTSAPSNIYGVLSDADFPYPTVTLSDGKSVRLDTANFSVLRASKNREDRQKVMSAFFEALGKFSGTFGSTMSAQVQTDVFYARAQVSKRTRSGPRRPESARVRLHATCRRSEPPPPHLPPIPRPPEEDDGRRGAALLRSLRAARLLG